MNTKLVIVKWNSPPPSETVGAGFLRITPHPLISKMDQSSELQHHRNHFCVMVAFSDVKVFYRVYSYV